MLMFFFHSTPCDRRVAVALETCLSPPCQFRSFCVKPYERNYGDLPEKNDSLMTFQGYSRSLEPTRIYDILLVFRSNCSLIVSEIKDDIC